MIEPDDSSSFTHQSMLPPHANGPNLQRSNMRTVVIGEQRPRTAGGNEISATGAKVWRCTWLCSTAYVCHPHPRKHPCVYPSTRCKQTQNKHAFIHTKEGGLGRGWGGFRERLDTRVNGCSVDPNNSIRESHLYPYSKIAKSVSAGGGGSGSGSASSYRREAPCLDCGIGDKLDGH